MISLAISPLTSSDCTDAGPWPCDIDGCPSPEVSCVDLVQLDYCAATIGEIWDPPPSGTNSADAVYRHCPRACGRCAPLRAGVSVDATDPAEAAMFEWLRAASPAVLEPGVRHADEQTLIAPSPLGGRGLFARRALAAGEPIHVVRTAHLIGGWPTQEDVLSPRAVGDVVRALRGDGARERAYTGLLPSHDDSVAALPELWSDEELALLQDDALVDLAKAAGTGAAALEAWHAELAAAHSWEPALTLDEVRWARALLQSRPLAIGGAPAAHARRYFLLPFIDMANTHLGGAQHANVRLSSVRADAVPAHMRGSELEIRAALVAARDVAEGEELLLDYGLDLTRTTVRYALLNYGIVASLDAASFRQQSLPRDPEGSLLCAPLWCIDNAPDYAGMTAARHAHKFPERIEMLERLLNTAPWNATTVDDDLGELIVARHALSSLPTFQAKRRVTALEYRLGCKLGAVSAVDEMLAIISVEKQEL